MPEVKWTDLKPYLPEELIFQMEEQMEGEGKAPEDFKVVLPEGVTMETVKDLFVESDEELPRVITTRVEVEENNLKIHWASKGHGFGLLEVTSLPGGVLDICAYGMGKGLVADIIRAAAPQLAELIVAADRMKEDETH